MIEAENLTRIFGTKIAVDAVSLRVERGEVLGFLGPNGAGKSTTMRMITGFISPSAGRIRVGGHDMLKDPIRARRRLGYLPENAPVYVDMTVRSFLMFCAELSGLEGDARKRAVNRVAERCFLESVLNQSIDTLSKGYRHRTCFAQAIIHDPDVLVLDEPTDGLDPNQKHEIRQLIRSMGQNKAIIFSTHILEEVEAVCSRAMIIDRGRIVANGTPAELRRRSESDGCVLMRLRRAAGQEAKQAFEALPQVRRVSIVNENGSDICLRIYPKHAGRGAELLRAVLSSANSWEVTDLRTETGRLDEVFRSITLPETVSAAPGSESAEAEFQDPDPPYPDTLAPSVRDETEILASQRERL